jgi:hypothetical protein
VRYQAALHSEIKNFSLLAGTVFQRIGKIAYLPVSGKKNEEKTKVQEEEVQRFTVQRFSGSKGRAAE